MATKKLFKSTTAKSSVASSSNEEPQGNETKAVAGEETANTMLPSRKVALGEIPIDSIIPSSAQARTEQNLTPESLQDLVASMKEHGILSRIRVRPVEGRDDVFELVYGERRWRSAKLAGFTHYPVEIANYTDDELAEIGLIENVQRKDLTPLEEAEKYQQLLNIVKDDGRPKYSIRKLAQSIGKDKGYIELRLAVLRGPEEVQELVRDLPDVPLRAAREIGQVEDQQVREQLIADIRTGGASTKVQDVKDAVAVATGKPRKESPAPSSPKLETVVVPSSFVQPALISTSNEIQVVSSLLPEIQEKEQVPDALLELEERFQEADEPFVGTLQFIMDSHTIEQMTPEQLENVLSYGMRWQALIEQLIKRVLAAQQG